MYKFFWEYTGADHELVDNAAEDVASQLPVNDLCISSDGTTSGRRKWQVSFVTNDDDAMPEFQNSMTSRGYSGFRNGFKAIN